MRKRRPNTSAWKEAIPVTGCGADAVLNIYFQAAKGGKVKTIVGFPGTTHADLVLQGDAQTYAILGAGLVDKDCKSFIVKDTRFEAFGLADPPKSDPGPDDAMRPWWETWTVAGCDRTFEVQLDFGARRDGHTDHSARRRPQGAAQVAAWASPNPSDCTLAH